MRDKLNKVDKALLESFIKSQNELFGLVVSSLQKGNKTKASLLYQKVRSINSTMITHYGERVRLELGMQYLLGASVVEKALKRNDLIKQINELGSLDLSQRTNAQNELIQSSLGVVHLEAVESLIEESIGKINTAINGIERNIRYSLGEIKRVEIQQTLAQGLITGETLQKSKNKVIDIFSKQGITAFTDRSGKKRGITRYAEMLVRTETIRAYNLGTINQGVSNGITQFRNLENADACVICQPYKDKILTIGKDRFPPHHPHCRRSLVPILTKEKK